MPGALRRRLGVDSCWTRSPVVTISSPIEEREEEDGWEDISTQESSSALMADAPAKGEGTYLRFAVFAEALQSMP